MKFIIFVFLICILFYLNSKKKIREHLVNNKKKWNNYRLGDLIKGECYRKPREKKYFFSIYKLFPNSIADEYIKKTNHLKKNRFSNIDILNEIIQKRSKNKNNLPKNTDLVVHLRIGDSIKDFKNGKFVYNERKKFKSKTYAIKLDSMNKILDSIDLSKIDRIILVFGAHLKNKEIVNELYLDKIEEIIKRRGILTIRKFSGNPDEDFIFMSNAKNFVSSNGYFSLFVSKIVERNNGLVLKSDGVK